MLLRYVPWPWTPWVPCATDCCRDRSFWHPVWFRSSTTIRTTAILAEARKLAPGVGRNWANPGPGLQDYWGPQTGTGTENAEYRLRDPFGIFPSPQRREPKCDRVFLANGFSLQQVDKKGKN